jgi:ATP-binding cassette subfamily C (CFTR/MRP) protein 10
MDKPNLWIGYTLAIAMGIRSLLSAISSTQYSLAWKRFEIRVRAGIISAIYRQTLQLSIQGKQTHGIGRITNLISVDLGRLVGIPGTIFDMWLIPGEICVALLLLCKEVSYAFVAGLVVLCLMLPLQMVLGGKIQQVTKKMLEYRDQRVNLTTECLKSIKIIKVYLAFLRYLVG